MKQLRVTDAAKRDLSDIASYTEATWGLDQKQKYIGALHERIKALWKNPSIGVVRDDAGQDCRSLACGSHQIFYRDSETTIIVLRVLHGSQDVHRHVDPGDPQR